MVVDPLNTVRERLSITRLDDDTGSRSLQKVADVVDVAAYYRLATR